MTDQPSGFMPDDYDRELARLDRVQGVARTRPAMIRHIPLLGVGGTATYSVTTCREAGDVLEHGTTTDEVVKRKPATFTVFLEVAKGERLQRIVIPHSVVAIIVRQRDALNTQVQKRAAKQAAATRAARGIKPTFGRKK